MFDLNNLSKFQMGVLKTFDAAEELTYDKIRAKSCAAGSISAQMRIFSEFVRDKKPE